MLGLAIMPRRSEKYSTYPFCAWVSTDVPVVPMVPRNHLRKLPTSISTAFITPLTLQLSPAEVTSRTSPSRGSYKLMGYQLYWLPAPVVILGLSVLLMLPSPL